MKVLVVGSGGREHALVWKIAQSERSPSIYCAPGNPGTAAWGKNVPIKADDIDGLLSFAQSEGIDLTMVGPEQPLCDGIQDRFTEAGMLLVGPTQRAARLEGSKIYAKQFMERHQIPTAAFGVFEASAAAAAYIDENAQARVIKADGLAAGKGVFVVDEAEQAKAAVDDLLAGQLGDAGKRVLIEERLVGEEVSVIALVDGERVQMLASSQDHKAAFDGDEGPNTGGMGAYSPAPVLGADLARRVEEDVLQRVVVGMQREGHPYRGVLYAGMMIVDGDLFVLEFNCRFGDPETQPLLLRIKDDLLPYLEGVARGALPEAPPRWDARAALCVVMAAGGYPGAYEKGKPIEGLSAANAMDDVEVFQAGTRAEGDQLLTAGGRVLGVTALGESLAAAKERAYQAVESIGWPEVHYRKDIGHRALARER